MSKLKNEEIDYIISTYKQFKSIEKTAKVTGFAKSTVNKYVMEISSIDKRSRYCKNSVDQIDLDSGKIIKQWIKPRHASLALNISESEISRVVAGELNQAGGYGWKKSKVKRKGERNEMLIQAIDRIEQIDTIENAARNCHVPNNATYVIVDNNFNYKVISKENFSSDNKYCIMDFYSRVIDINKAVDRKKLISSNNYLTFFYKEKNVNKIINSDIIDNYYINLETTEDKLIYRDWIKENISKLSSKTSNGIIKIFFAEDIKEYMKLGKKYMEENILSNTVEINKIKYGTSLFINLNYKKLYLKNKTRKSNISELLTVEEALKCKYFIDLLTSFLFKGCNIIYILENGQIVPINSSKDISEIKFTNGIIIAYKLNSNGKLVILDVDHVNK